jgi:hypothetical protein
MHSKLKGKRYKVYIFEISHKKNLSQIIITEKFSKLVTYTKPQIQEVRSIKQDIQQK